MPSKRRYYSFICTEEFVPYNVSIMPRNPAGCGEIFTLVCFTQEGGMNTLCMYLYECLSLSVPETSPSNVSMTHTNEVVIVTWQPFTLVEARGFIEYIVQLHIVPSAKRQGGPVKRVPMDQSSAVFTNVNTSSTYEASVGTVSLSGDITGLGQLTYKHCIVCAAVTVK